MKLIKIVALLVSTTMISVNATDVMAREKQTIADTTQQLDIESIEPIVLPKPTFDSLIAPSKQKIKKINFQLLESTDNSDTPLNSWIEENHLGKIEYSVPSEASKENTVPKEIPLNYKNYRLTKALDFINCNMFFYGNNFAESRFLLITNKERTKVLHFFDFGNYSIAPKTKSGDEDFVYQQLTWALMDSRDVLYVSTAHPTYAASSFGKNAYVTAIDLKTNKVLWRSQPLVSNSNFTIVGEYVVSGYGFTDEKDYLYYINKYSGKTVGRIFVKSAPSYIDFKFNQLYVQTYNANYYFKITE